MSSMQSPMVDQYDKELNESLRILIAEDDSAIAMQYKIALEARNHSVVVTADGEQCIKVYSNALKGTGATAGGGSPFDVVVLDYRMPNMDGMEAAKHILAMNPNQRIIFASAYVKETLIESVQKLRQIVEFIEKPFRPFLLVGILEDKKTGAEIERINALIREIKDFRPDAEAIRTLHDALVKIQKGRDYLIDALDRIEDTVRRV
ncbi:MAG: response regulator [Nitrososphaerales archaeon]